MLSGALGFQILARRLGVELGKPQFAHIEGIDDTEINPNQIKLLAKKHEIVCKAIKTNLSGLEKACKVQPILCRLKTGRYIILVKVDQNDDNSQVTILDPSDTQPRPKTIEAQDFLKSWGNQSFIFQKSKKLARENQEISLGAVLDDLFEKKIVIIQLFIIITFLNIFALSPIIFLIIVLDKVVNFEAYSTLYVVASGVVLAHIFNLLLSRLKTNIMSLSASKIEAKYGVSIFGEVISLPLSVLQSQTNQVRKLTQTLSQIRTTIIQKLLGSITDFVSVLFFVPILFFYSPLLGVIVLGFCSISSIYSFIHSRKHKLLVNQTFQADQRRQELLATTVDGFEDIKRLGLEEEIFNQWKNFEGEYIKSNEKSSSSSSSVNEVGTLLNNLLTVIVLFVGVHMVFSGDLSAGVLIGVNMLIGKIYRPTLNLVDLPSDLKKFSELLGNLKKSAGLSSEDRGSGQYHPIQGGITFQNVAFSFKDNVNVIDNVSINIAPGEIIGICGPSGSGKTILGELVQGLFNPNEGKVFIDGNDIRTFNIQHLRSQISIVGGNQYFFPGSIRENMQRIFPNANNDRILWATKLAKVNEDIEKLEKGYETPLGDSVADISPAMKQKLAIARAIIRNPKILVLDDIFANLDTPNELQIMSGIPDLARGRTLIIISQQLWYLRHCRKIMFMNQGKVEQFGDTQTVISEKGPIQSFLNQQLNIVSPKLEGQQKLIFDQ